MYTKATISFCYIHVVILAVYYSTFLSLSHYYFHGGGLCTEVYEADTVAQLVVVIVDTEDATWC